MPPLPVDDHEIPAGSAVAITYYVSVHTLPHYRTTGNAAALVPGSAGDVPQGA